jgi:hypothetical protein
MKVEMSDPKVTQFGHRKLTPPNQILGRPEPGPGKSQADDFFSQPIVEMSERATQK